MAPRLIAATAACGLMVARGPAAYGQTTAPNAPGLSKPAAAADAASGVPDYVIGADDTLSVIFWREKDMSTEVVVRPDGNISLPLLNDVLVAGLTPEQLRVKLNEEAKRYITDPAVTVMVKQINSRRVYVMGMVQKPGPYPLMSPTTVLQLISTAGGLLEYAKQDKIVVIRAEHGRQVRHEFNYKQVVEGKNLTQNIDLKPGDTVVVP